MPTYDVDVARVIRLRLQADTAEEARQRALTSVREPRDTDLRVLQLVRIDEEQGGGQVSA